MKRFYRWLVLVILLSLSLWAVACRDQAEPDAAGPEPEPVIPTATLAPTPTVAPTATALPWPDVLEVVSNIENLERFLPQSPFALQFNQPMKIESSGLPLLISPFLEGTYQWNETGTRLTYAPDGGFAPGRAYTIVLDSALEAASGLTFQDELQWQIQVMSAPQVIKRTPAGRQLASRRPGITLTFDREMSQSSVLEALSIHPAVPFESAWKGNTLTLTPREALAPDMAYYFTLKQTAVDSHGVPLTGDYLWSYRAAPLLAEGNLTLGSNRDPIIIRFNYRMEPESVRKAIQFRPAIVGDLTWSENGKVATFTPAAPLPASASYTLSFAQALLEANGDAFPIPAPLQITTPPPILGAFPTGDNVHPATVVEVTFDRPVDDITTAAAFTIAPASTTPDVPGSITWRETTLVFTPAAGFFDEFTEYVVTIDSSARDIDGQPLLADAYQWSFQTGRLQDIADFGWGPNAQVVDADGRRAVQFQLYQSRDAIAASPSPITLELYRLNLVQFLDRYASGFRGVAGWEDDRPISTEGAPLAASWKAEIVEPTVPYQNIQEAIIPADVRPGLYILNLEAGHVNDQLILLLSRNTIAVKQTGRQLVAWVTDINGGSRGDVAVEVYARDGELISSGRSDGNGVFRTTIDRDAQPLIVVARDGIAQADITASGLSNEWRSNNRQWWGWWNSPPSANAYAAYIYTDRPIYRPGQLVFYKAIVRQDDDAVLNILPEGTPVTVRIRDARNNVVQTVELLTNHFGTVNGAFQLADGAMLGQYAVELVMDQAQAESHRQTFKVEDYRKPDYQVSVTTNGERFITGERIDVTIDTNYFFGEPVPNADIVVNTFVLAERYWWDENRPGEADFIWFNSYDPPVSGGRTDSNGRFTFSWDAKSSYQAQAVDWQSNLQQSIIAIEATVDDGSHQTVSGFAIVKVYSAAEKLRLDTAGYFYEPGQVFHVDAEVRDIFDQPVAGRSLELSLRRWESGSYDYTRVVQSSQLASDGNGRAAVEMAIAQPGFYQLRLTGTDRRGNPLQTITYVYAFSDGYDSWFGRDGDLNISADRESYAPGETATLIIESSFSGPALLTFERGSVRREQLVQLSAPVTLVDVAIQPDDAPNIYVTVNAWAENDTALNENTWESQPDSRLYVASVNLSVPVTDKSLIVTITPDKSTYAPREEATITVLVTNRAGVPVSAEVSLAMVDEAIFALSEDLSGSIFDAFYHERDNTVRTYDALALVRYLGGGFGGGGGGDMEGNPRSDFPDTAEWFPVLHTDFSGQASVTFTLPDSLTSWRLTAKATTADTQVGEIFTSIVTRQDIVVRPILPRILTAGDQVSLSAIVHNYSDTPQAIDVRLVADETQFTVPGSSVDTITLAPGELRLVGWSVKALAAGEGQIIIQAAVGDQVRDAVQLPLEIRPLAVPDVDTQVGQFRGQLATAVVMPANTLPMSGVRIELSRSIAGSLLEGLDYLTGFPYGCVEQTMSRALPNAVVGRAFFQLGVSNPTMQADLPAKINAGLQRLYGYQHNDGGWGWWFDDSSHDYQTAWVIFGLAVMRDAGYEVDSGVIQRGVDWLNENLAAMDVRTQAYALYSMAVAGYPNLDALLAVAQREDELDTFSLAGLALAFHESGEDAEADDILNQLAATAVVSDDGKVYWAGTDYDGAYYQKTMASSLRSTALALSAFAQIRPGNELEPGIVRWLMSQRRQSGWGTTNETSYAILGLTDHLLATSFSESATDTQYTLLLNGETFATGSLGRGEPAVSLEIPAGQLKPGTNAIGITQSGSGQLYYTISNRVYLAQEEIEAAGVISVHRAYMNLENGRQIKSVSAGQLVRVQLTVTLPEDASYVIVEDSLPAGLEALNESLNTSSHVATAYEEPTYWQEYGYNYKEIRGGRVTFFITEMSRGSHTFTYIARATHAGEFVAMPVEAYAMYDLSTWGRSASGRITVTK